MQYEFFAAALDGPTQTNESDLAIIHAGMGITRHHLTQFVGYLIDVVAQRETVTRGDAMEIIYRIAVLSDGIVGGPGGTDG